MKSHRFAIAKFCRWSACKLPCLAIALLASGIADKLIAAPQHTQRFQRVQPQERQRFQANPQIIRGLHPNNQTQNQVSRSFEAEAAGATANGGAVANQNMRQFGSWSGDQQIIWTGNRPGQLLRIPFNVAAAGEYNVVVHMTKANDFGDVAIGMDGKQLATFSGFSTRVEPAQINLGKVRLRRGRNELIFSVTGKFSRSSGYRVGVDRIVTTRTATPTRPPNNRIPNRPPVNRPPMNQPPANQPPSNLPPNRRPWSDVPVDRAPRPELSLPLPTGLMLYRKVGSNLKIEPYRMDNWGIVKFFWDRANLAQCQAVLWQVTTEFPPNETLTSKTPPLKPLFIPGFVKVGKSNNLNFEFDFSTYRHLIDDPFSQSFYVRAIPIDNLNDRNIVGQPSNILAIQPPLQLNSDALSDGSTDGNLIVSSTNPDFNGFKPQNYQAVSKDYSIMVAGRFGGSRHTDVFAYNRITGSADVLISNGNGKLTISKSLGNWRKTWDVIVPGNFNADHVTDLFLYSRRTKEAKILYFNQNMSYSTGHHFENLQLWDEVVPGQFDGSGPTDLLFYSRLRGEAKFMSITLNGWQTLATHGDWKMNWDKIVPFTLNSDSWTDLLFYRKVRGDLEICTTRNGQVKTLSKSRTRPDWDVIVPGEFGRTKHTDFFFYSRVAQVGRYAISHAGSLEWKAESKGIGAYFSHILSGNFGTRTQPISNRGHGNVSRLDDLVFYDNHYEIRVHAIRCMDSDGDRPTNINPEQVSTWLEETNEFFTQAGIKFLYDPENDFEELRHTTINTLDTRPSTRVFGMKPDEFESKLQQQFGITEDQLEPDYNVPAGWTTNQAEHLHNNIEAYQEELQRVKDIFDETIRLRNSLAGEYAATKPGKLVVYFRWGANKKETGSGYSGPGKQFVVMPGANANTTYFYEDTNHPHHNKSKFATKLFAHEIGHYLGLSHTFGGYTKVPKNADDENKYLANFLERKGIKLESLDGDRDTVLDTPPDIHRQYFLNRNLNPANLNTKVILKKDIHGLGATVMPDRHNIMSYFGYCNEYVSITTDQVNRMRTTLHSDKAKHLLGLPVIGKLQGTATPSNNQ